jgi:KipI family sensor histidine kinase inhibitor
MNNLTVVLEPAAPRLEELLHDLRVGWEQSDAAGVTPRQIEIPVQYGGTAGVDLEQVAQHTGLSADQIIQLHAGAEYTVYFLGFVPGFAYLGGLDPRLATPRRAQPRLSVAAGSVAIGGTHTGVYPSACPGGWQLIGRTALSLFDPARDPPSLLLPGDTVRFVDLGGRA